MGLAIRERFKSTKNELDRARKCENINDPFDTYVIDYISIFFTKIFVKLHIIPNVVTLLSMISGIAGGILIALPEVGYNISGAVLVLLSAVFDACDGQVARLTKHYSRLGRMLDGLSDGSVYFTLFTACVIRLWDVSPIDNEALWRILIILSGVIAFIAYVVQCQLPDYYKNLHMYMIDNSHGNELSRAKDVRNELDRTNKGGFERFSLFCYYNYTNMQEKRAPKAQKMLDSIEKHGKSDNTRALFCAESSKLVKLTNLMTFNLRTAVLLLSVFLHAELVGLLFDIVVLEPIRVVLLRKYEDLCERTGRSVIAEAAKTKEPSVRE